jgi:hypothetical protein
VNVLFTPELWALDIPYVVRDESPSLLAHLTYVPQYHSNGRVRSSSVTKAFLREMSSPAEVICWSGSTDSGTSADVQGGGIAVGAMSYAFLSALSKSLIEE